MPRLDGLQQALPADRIVATNSTKVACTTHHYLSAEQPRSWLVSYGFATSAPPCRWPSVRSSRSPTDPSPRSAGDGGRLLTIAALGTAVDPLLPLPVLVYDNRRCAEIRDSFDRRAAPRGRGDERARPAGNRGRLRHRDRRGEHSRDARRGGSRRLGRPRADGHERARERLTLPLLSVAARRSPRPPRGRPRRTPSRWRGAARTPAPGRPVPLGRARSCPRAPRGWRRRRRR
jgi:hypothetical protein